MLGITNHALVSYCRSFSYVISLSEESSNYMDSTGVEQKVFISRTAGGDPLQGYYSNKMVKYPDFTSSDTASWWYTNLTQYSNG